MSFHYVTRITISTAAGATMNVRFVFNDQRLINLNLLKWVKIKLYHDVTIIDNVLNAGTTCEVFNIFLFLQDTRFCLTVSNRILTNYPGRSCRSTLIKTF